MIEDMVNNLLELVSQEYGVSASDLKSKSRRQPLPEARRMICLLSNSNILRREARRILDIEYCTFYQNVNKINFEIELYQDTASRYKNLLNRLSNEDKAN